MALKTVIKNLTKARKAYEKQLEAIGDDASKAVAEHLAEFIPEGFLLQWTQSVPSFNDGEPCTFSVDHPVIAKVTPSEDEEGDDTPEIDDGQDDSLSLSKWGLDTYGQVVEAEGRRSAREADPEIEGLTRAQALKLADAWSELPEDLLQKAFGDNARVTIRPDGTYVNNDYCCY